MSSPCQNLYAFWRAHHHPFAALQENSAAPPERLLQSIWHHQRIRRDSLRVADGRKLRVLHPGFWNHGAGPDFRDAVLQLDDVPPFSCDVEIDIAASGWRGHAHDRNPAFAKVGLHVIWEEGATLSVPTLLLRPVLDAPLAELALWLGTEPAKRYPEELLGRCASPLRDLSEPELERLLKEAALVRLQRKATDLHARARQVGWEQALWEGLMRALGYKQNVWPMQRLGELRPRIFDPAVSSPLHLQARLLGVSGLLPADARRGARKYVRQVWDHWWRERNAFDDCILPPSLWRLNALRPANRPERRLALAAHWWSDKSLVPRVERWFTDAKRAGEFASSLLPVLQSPEDEFWSWHWTLRSTRMESAQPLLGKTRVTDLAINVVLPWLWIRAREGRNDDLQAQAEARYFAWPCAEDNAVLRLARNRLLGGRVLRKFRTAAMQQGLMQIVRDFCDHSDALCGDCKFTQLLRNWKIEGDSESRAH